MEREQGQPLPAWVAPAVVAATAIPTFVAFWIGGNPRTGLVWAVVALAFAALLAVASRSDALRILAGLDDDERTRDVDRRATAAMGMVLVVALVVCFLGSAARGESGLVFGVLLVLADGDAAARHGGHLASRLKRWRRARRAVSPYPASGAQARASPPSGSSRRSPATSVLVACSSAGRALAAGPRDGARRRPLRLAPLRTPTG